MDENTLVNNTLNNYEFHVSGYTKVRSAYKVESDGCYFCLKKIKHGKNKPENGNKLVQELSKVGFDNTAKYYTTKDGRILVKNKKCLFYVTDWIDGTECDLKEIEEACKCSKLLAQFHRAANSIERKDFKIRNNIRNWPKIFNSNQYDLDNFKRKIERKKLRSEFDKLFYEHIDNFIKRGIIALNFLNTSEYYKISKEADKSKTICHDSFYYQNIIKKENEFYIIDLDSIIFDLQINDLGKLIRRLMYKSEYSWDFTKARRIIESYCSVNPLTKGELEVMLALIIYPHKFWKLGKKRYVKCKNWDESKYVHKLLRLINYDEQQEKFLEEYLKFLGFVG